MVVCSKGLFTIINIYESVQRVLFCVTPPQSVLKMLIFFKSHNINNVLTAELLYTYNLYGENEVCPDSRHVPCFIIH